MFASELSIPAHSEVSTGMCVDKDASFPLSRHPILVTGAHRSGSTWVGRVLASAPRVAYIHEPFNVTNPPSPGICGARFHYWFTYVTTANENPYYASLKKTIELRYDFPRAIAHVRSVHDSQVVQNEYRQFSRFRRQRCIALLKDPIALLSTEWLVDRFSVRPVVLIRHPAAFVSSLLRLGWTHPFQHFLAQELLMHQMLGPFAAEIQDFAARERDIVDQGILLWRIFHFVIQRFREAHANWIFVRHEDLSQDVHSEFAALCQRLDLQFSPGVEKALRDYSGAHNPRDPEAPVGSESALRRDSRRNVVNWKYRLSPNIIDKIRADTLDVAHDFYGEDDW